MLRGAMSPEMGRAEDVARKIRIELEMRGLHTEPLGIDIIEPPVLLYSAVPHTLITLARTGYGIAIVPSQTMTIPREGIRTVPLIHRGASIGKWAMIAWDAQRFLAPYAKQFVNELVASVRRDFPGRDLVRRHHGVNRRGLERRRRV